MNLVEFRELPAWNCDCNMFILSNGRALFGFRLQFLKGTGVADPERRRDKVSCMPKALIRVFIALTLTLMIWFIMRMRSSFFALTAADP